MKTKIVVFTGAGISAESGLKTFRDSDGMWENYNIEEVATPQAWAKNPKLVLEFYNARYKNIQEAEPNIAHKAIVKLEQKYDVQIITQNIDDLHERAGSKKILHLHGEIVKSRSIHNHEKTYAYPYPLSLGMKAPDGGQLRPHIVWFGEMVPKMELACNLCKEADYFVVIGSSMQVYPAASIIQYTPQYTKKIIIDPKAIAIPNAKGIRFITEIATIGVVKWVDEMLNL